MTEVEQFHVFLCHNSQDKPAVIELAKRLQAEGLKPWLDDWELAPGLPWQAELERQIENIQSAAVCIGRSGIGPWQRQELDSFLRKFVNRRCPVIPVLLEDAPQIPQLPVFLEAMTWVDFRPNMSPYTEPIVKLIWGITGKKPEPKQPSDDSQLGAVTEATEMQPVFSGVSLSGAIATASPQIIVRSQTPSQEQTTSNPTKSQLLTAQDNATSALLNTLFEALYSHKLEVGLQKFEAIAHKSLFCNGKIDPGFLKKEFTLAFANANRYKRPVHIISSKPGRTRVGSRANKEDGEEIIYSIARNDVLGGLPGEVRIFFSADDGIPRISGLSL